MKDEEEVRLRALSADLLSALQRHGLERNRAEAVVHAIVDIDESVRRVAESLVPRLIEAAGAKDEEFKERLWDIREEFRHVEYHLRDAGLVDL